MFNMITECKACKQTVSKDAKTCPHCGQRTPGRETVLNKLFFLTLLLLAASFIFS